jgi:hypothetical protein
MDRVEMLLAATLSDRAEQAPVGPVRLDEASSRRRPITLAVVAASAAVVLVAVGLASLGGSGHRTTPVAPHHHDRLLPTPASLPSGVRLASYGAVSLRVPASLPTRTSLCGQAVENEVVASDGASSLCPIATDRLSAHPGVVVWLSSYSEGNPYMRIPTSPGRLADQDVQRGYATNLRDLGTGVSGVVRLPSERIMVGVTAPTRAAVDQLLNSIHTARVNPLGCASRFGAAVHLTPGPASVIVPAGANAAIRCEYASSGPSAGILTGSYRLDGLDTTRIADALNGLRPDPCHCVHGGTPAPGHGEIVYFRIENDWTLGVIGTIGANLDSYTNGARTVANYSGTVASLLSRLTHQF